MTIVYFLRVFYDGRTYDDRRSHIENKECM